MKRLLAAGIAVIAAVGIAACGDDGGDPVETTSSASTPSASTSVAPNSNPNVKPNEKSLNDMIDKALDPKVPASQKTELIQGSEKDPKIFDKLVKGKQDNPDIKWKIVPPITRDATNRNLVHATVSVTLPGQPAQKVNADIIYDGGKWKLAKSTVCGLAGALNVKTTMC